MPTNRAEYLRKWRLANPGKAAEHNRRWRAAHPEWRDINRQANARISAEKWAEYSKRWQLSDSEGYRKAHRDHYYRNQEARQKASRERQRQKRVTDREAINAQLSAWRRKNAKKVYAWNLLREARKRQLPYEDVDREEILMRDDNRCRGCGATFTDECPVTLDHIIPLTKGGPWMSANLQALCRSCNSRKGNRGYAIVGS